LPWSGELVAEAAQVDPQVGAVDVVDAEYGQVGVAADDRVALGAPEPVPPRQRPREVPGGELLRLGYVGAQVTADPAVEVRGRRVGGRTLPRRR
jgi:hypothetical protein